MTPEEIQKFNQLTEQVNTLIDIISRMNTASNFLLQKDLVLFNADIEIQGGQGMKIGKNTTDKLSFYGVPTVDQPAAVTAPTGGATVDSQARTAITTILSRLQELGLTA